MKKLVAELFDNAFLGTKASKDINIYIDTDCKECRSAVKQFVRIQKIKTKKIYGAISLSTSKMVRGFVLRPDFNSCGCLTHWHLEREKRIKVKGKYI